MRRRVVIGGAVAVGLGATWLLWPASSPRPVPQPVPRMALDALLPGLLAGWRENPSVESAWILVETETGTVSEGDVPEEVVLGSLRKWTTAAVLLALYDHGELDIDAPVGTWLPTWSDRSEVTLRRLLSNTSGLPMRPPAGTCRGLGTLAACVDAVAEVPLAFEPGTRFGYSTTGFHVAARVAEVVSGVTYEDVFAERVSVPLGLESPRFEAAGPGLPEMTGALWLAPPDLLRFVRGAGTGEGAKGRWLSDEAVALWSAGHTGAVPKVGTIPRGEWWAEGEDPYGLGVWRAGMPVDGCPRFLFSEGKQAVVAGYDRVFDRAFVVGFTYAEGTGVAGRVLPHEVLQDLCVAGERVAGMGVDDAEVRCLPFVPTPEAQQTYRTCRAGRGDHRLCLTAARRVTAGSDQ